MATCTNYNSWYIDSIITALKKQDKQPKVAEKYLYDFMDEPMY